jgi:hypothetical protein
MTEPFATHKDRVVIPSQVEKFKQAARKHEADEDEAHWDERLRKVAKAAPKPSSPAD